MLIRTGIGCWLGAASSLYSGRLSLKSFSTTWPELVVVMVAPGLPEESEKPMVQLELGSSEQHFVGLLGYWVLCGYTNNHHLCIYTDFLCISSIRSLCALSSYGTSDH